MNPRETLFIDESGRLKIGGADCAELAKRFHTPLYVFDEAHIRAMMRAYRTAIEEDYAGNGLVLYASKAFSCTAIYAIAKEEGIGVDVVSGGELYTARQADFPAEKIYFHGNNKLLHELEEAVDCGCTIVIDALSEAKTVDRLAEERGIVQPVLVRVNPGVEAHTHKFVQTATPDSKFGFSIANGQAEEAVKTLLLLKHLDFRGLHCHIGSQIFEGEPFAFAAQTCIRFAADMKRKHGFVCRVLDLGGGFGIWYNDKDPARKPSDYRALFSALIAAVKEGCDREGIGRPYLLVEPGRSIVGEAGITLYTVGAIKEIPGIRTYVAIDGGMFENPRYCLYQAEYTALLAERAAEAPVRKVTLAGKCCESGDLIGVDMLLPEVKTGDVIAVLSTGAYNYSMASNYNRNPIPPAVLVRDGHAEYIVKPQSYEDLVRSDVIPPMLRPKISR